jgi:hypothetical protein
LLSAPPKKKGIKEKGAGTFCPGPDLAARETLAR